MANETKRERREATLLAAAMAVVGGTLLFGKLGALVPTVLLLLQTVSRSATLLFLVFGICLIAAFALQEESKDGRSNQKGDQQ